MGNEAPEEAATLTHYRRRSRGSASCIREVLAYNPGFLAVRVSATVTGDLLNQGLTLMLAGMGTVFGFLTTLVLAMSLMSRLVQRFSPRPTAERAVDEALEAAAVAAAVDHHRRITRP